MLNFMVAYFCHQLSDIYVNSSDIYVDSSDIYVNSSNIYVNSSDIYVDLSGKKISISSSLLVCFYGVFTPLAAINVSIDKST